MDLTENAQQSQNMIRQLLQYGHGIAYVDEDDDDDRQDRSSTESEKIEKLQLNRQNFSKGQSKLPNCDRTTLSPYNGDDKGDTLNNGYATTAAIDTGFVSSSSSSLNKVKQESVDLHHDNDLIHHPSILSISDLVAVDDNNNSSSNNNRERASDIVTRFNHIRSSYENASTNPSNRSESNQNDSCNFGSNASTCVEGLQQSTITTVTTTENSSSSSRCNSKLDLITSLKPVTITKPKWLPSAVKSPNSDNRVIHFNSISVLKSSTTTTVKSKQYSNHFDRAKSFQPPPIPRKPSFLQKKRPQSSLCANETKRTSDENEPVETNRVSSSAQSAETTGTGSQNGNEQNFNPETNSIDSRDSKSRPLQVAQSQVDSNRTSIESSTNVKEVIENAEGASSPQIDYSTTGVSKTGSLDSGRTACCTSLAFNIYSKALESAKKALPKHKHQKNPHYKFPRSFGEDFHSLGPDAFNYLDDSQTECSGSYKDIDFNRDSYYGGNVIPEEAEFLPDTEPAQSKQTTMADEPKPIIYLPSDESPTAEQMQTRHDLNSDLPYYEKEQVYAKSEDSIEPEIEATNDENYRPESSASGDSGTVQKKGSFIGRIFRGKRDRSVEKDSKKTTEKSASKKTSSQSCECSREKSIDRGCSLPPGSVGSTDAEKSLIASLEELNAKRTPSPTTEGGGSSQDDDKAIISNISRQSPVHLVYSQPPEIFIEECRTLPKNADELAAHTSQMILSDVLNEMSNDPRYANLEFSPDIPQYNSESKLKEKRDAKKKKVANPKKFFKRFGAPKSKDRSSEQRIPEPTITIQVTEAPEIQPSLQTEEGELQERPLSSVSVSKSGKERGNTKAKKLSLKKDHFKLKDKFKYKKKQKKDSLGAHAKRQLPTLPESRHSTLSSSHVYDHIEHKELAIKETDEFGNVIIEIGKPIEPGVDYFSQPESEVEPETPEVELGKNYESIEVAEVKPDLPPPPKILKALPADPDRKSTFFNQIDPSCVEFSTDPPIIIGSIAIFQRNVDGEGKDDEMIAVTVPPEQFRHLSEEAEVSNEPKSSKINNKMSKMKNEMKSMMGSLGSSVRAKVDKIKDKVKKTEEKDLSKESMEREAQENFKETNLDEESTQMHDECVTENQLPQQPEQQQHKFSFRNFAPVESPASTSEKIEDITPTAEGSYEVDADLDEAIGSEQEKKKKSKRKFKLIRSKKPVQTNEPNEISDERERPKIEFEPTDEGSFVEPKQSWSSRNRERLERLRSRAAESFKEVKERIAAKAAKRKKDNAGNRRHAPDSYEYEFKFASDTELSPGSGVDSLRRAKVYRDLADAQERLELYMSPVGASGPLRPPRSSKLRSIADESYQATTNASHRSMPSLAAVQRRHEQPPPRPPPPKLHSYHSVPAIDVAEVSAAVTNNAAYPAEDEISLTTSMSSLFFQRNGSRRTRRAARNQRVPADIFYRNVRLGFRPKKSYIDMLEKSQNFYSMANLHRCESLCHIPTAPSRKSKTRLTKRHSARTASSPPPPNSRASLVSNYGEVGGRNSAARFYEAEIELDPQLIKEKELYEKYEKPKAPPPSDPLEWKPFSWKAKRCRSLTEIDVRGQGRAKQVRASEEPIECESREYRSPTPSEYAISAASFCQSQPKKPPHATEPMPHDETYSRKIFSWLTSTTSLDGWRRNKRERSMPSKPPRPPPPRPPLRTKSRPSSPTSACVDFFPSSFSYFPSSFNHNTALIANTANMPLSNFVGRPLPPPPVPPRPKLIPAHYATGRRVEKRDASVDTSENGFLAYLCSEKETQVKLPGSLLNADSQLIKVHTPPTIETNTIAIANTTAATETNLDDDDEVTIVDEINRKSVLPQVEFSRPRLAEFAGSRLHESEDKNEETITSVTSVYTDARSRLTGEDSNDNNELTPVPNNVRAALTHDYSDEDDTINDDLSSLSSNYQSLCSTLQSVSGDNGGGVNSWLHRQRAASPSAVAEVDYQAAANGEIDAIQRRQQQQSAQPQPQQQQHQSSRQPVSTVMESMSTTDEFLTATEGEHAADMIVIGDDGGVASNRSSLLSNDPMLSEENEDFNYAKFQQTFLHQAPIVSANDDDGDDGEIVQPLDAENQSDNVRTIRTEPEEDSSTAAEAKRINRQSVISIASSGSSDTSSFHTTSSTSSSYSYTDLSIGFNAATTGSEKSKIASTFYVSSGDNDEKNTISSLATANTSASITSEDKSATAIIENSNEEEAIVCSSDVSKVDDSIPTTTAASLSVVLSPDLPENLCRLPKTTPKGREPDKRYFFAYEMYTTERDYVDVLKMLTEEFREAIQGIVPDYFIQKFFRPLDAVLPINRRLLDDLEKRVLVDWDDNPRVSDIMKNICPYFKEYSIYVREFESLNLMLDGMQTDSPHFHEALMRFQALDRCKKLSIKNYLLKPIQRLPQYPLLLHGYIKQLSPDNPDYEETKRAHEVVTEVVEHINRESLMGQKAMQLNDLKNRIITRSPDLIVKPGRELIKQGMLNKLSRKDIQERYFILFNDALLYLMPVMNEMLRLNEEFPLDGMEVQISNQADNEFMIRSFKRSFALMAYDSAERQEWVEVLEKTISEYEAKQCSFEAARMHTNTGGSDRPEGSSAAVSRRSTSPNRRPSVVSENDSNSCSDSLPPNDASPSPDKKLHQQPSIQSNSSNGTVERRSSHMTSLGERAPVWVHDRRVTMCQRCTRAFTFIFRRHHCRACGCVVCTDCSSKTYPLKYRRFEAQRVCDVCFSELTHQHPEWWSEANVKANVSTRVSPNHSLSNADLGMIGQKCRSNSCTDLGRSPDWITADGSSSTPPDQNHNPSATLNLNFIRNKYRNSSRAAKNIPAVLYEVWANDSTCTISGFMYRLSVSKKWKRYWFLIKGMVLYTYRASEDVAALETLPLPGYIVSTSKESIKGFPASSIIELSHPGRSTIYFHPETPQTHERWLKAFEESVKLH